MQRRVHDHCIFSAAVLAQAYFAALCALAADPQDQSPILVDRVFVKHIQQIQVPATQAGVLNAVLVKEGDVVVENQILARLKEDAAQLAKQRVETRFNIAEKQSQDETLVQSADKKLAQAKQALKQHAIELEISKQMAANKLKVQAAEHAETLATNELRRAEQAKREFNDSVSQSEIENLKLTLQRAVIDAQQAKFEQEIAKRKFEAASEEYQSSLLNVEQLQVELDHARATQVIHQLQAEFSRVELAEAVYALDQFKLKAPVKGMVVERYRDVGEWLEEGTPVVRIIKLDRLRVEGYLPIRSIRFDLKGAAATIHVIGEANREMEFKGQVTFVDPQVDSVNGEVLFWAEFDNPKLLAKPGMQGKIQIHSSAFAARKQD